jgi:hypothetical protein
MDKEKILNIIKKYSTFDIDGNCKYVDALEYNMLANKLLEAINVIHCCTQLKEKEALTFDEFKDEFYYKAQMGIYESKASGMFYNLNELKKRYQKYCLRCIILK